MKILKIVFVLLLVGACSACTTLPDIKPFADATAALGAAVKATGPAVKDSLELAAVPESDIKAFDDAWAARVRAASAISNYSSRIAELVASGQTGQSAAERIADGISTLSASLGLAFGPVSSIAVDAFKLVNGEIAKIRATKSLADATSAAKPAVHQFADAMERDGEKLMLVLDGAEAARRTAAKKENLGLEGTYKNYLSRLEALRKVSIAAPDADATKEPREALVRQKARAEGAELLTLFAEVRSNWLAYEASQLAAKKANAARKQLVRELSLSVNAWANAHDDIQQALSVGRQVNIAQLVQSLAEIQDLIKRIGAV